MVGICIDIRASKEEERLKKGSLEEGQRLQRWRVLDAFKAQSPFFKTVSENGNHFDNLHLLFVNIFQIALFNIMQN